MKRQVRMLLLIPALPGLIFLMIQCHAWYLEGLSAEFDLTFLVYGVVACYFLYLGASGIEPKRLQRWV
jgi:heme/copper-type cytochrome/quinol oxidase subunit 3